MGCILDRPPLCASIERDDCCAGHTTFPDDSEGYDERRSDDPQKLAYIKTRVFIEVAATIAHDFKSPRRAHDSGDKRDECNARRWIGGIQVADREEYLRCCRRRADELISQHWSWIEAVARALIEKRELRGSDVSKLRP
jgi:hypothetical protein